MDRRLEFHSKLVSIPGVKKVYFQPPASINLEYPCIIYSRSRGDFQYADNGSYIFRQAYDVTVIDRDPDSGILEHIRSFPMVVSDRSFRVDNLNHDTFTIYF